jgi:hypothetical protein
VHSGWSRGVPQALAWVYCLKGVAEKYDAELLFLHDAERYASDQKAL